MDEHSRKEAQRETYKSIGRALLCGWAAITATFAVLAVI